MTEPEQLTQDEKGLVATAIRYGPFPPKPKYLADCHRLMERGWFDRSLPTTMSSSDSVTEA